MCCDCMPRSKRRHLPISIATISLSTPQNGRNISLALSRNTRVSPKNKKKSPSSSDGHHLLSQSAQAASSNPGYLIDPLSEPTTNANSTLNKIKHPAGNKHAKLDQQDGAWQRSLAKSQQMMAEQMEKQNKII